jgi:predicted phosphate transport protein (TIGR00153 family)
MARTTNPLGNLFGRSPFSPLQAHMTVAVGCAQLVPSLFEALIAADWETVEKIKEDIFEREAEADSIKNELRMNLPRSLFMPVDRRDLLEVLQMQDSIADTAQDIAGLLVERRMDVPVEMAEPLIALTRRCIDVCVGAEEIIKEIDELLETGFRGREATRVESMINEVNRVEDETDELGIALTRKLFQLEGEMAPVSVMFWYQLIQWIGDLADYSEKVGDRIRLLIAK